MKTLLLKKNEDRRVREGHCWIFSNEVDTTKTPLKAFEPGECARVEAAGGRPLGLATINPGALICGRLVSREARDRLDPDFFRERVRTALELRERCFDKPFYRLVFSESDFLPGLIVDRFGGLLSVQFLTAGMERVREAVLEALRDVVRPSGILLKNDSRSRELEGLPKEVVTAWGDVPETLGIEENGTRFAVSPASGQKTGWYYDMRANRASLLPFAAGKRVLDAFCYAGALGVAAARAGAEAVTCLDASGPALEAVARNAALNDVAERVECVKADAFEALSEMLDQGRRFDLVSLDPPAFIQRRKDVETGTAAYRKANRLALGLVEHGGLLLTCSCSQHLSRDDLRRVLQRAAQEARVRVRIIRQGHQDMDHPVHPAMPETDYLKGFLVQVLRD
ncbi:class I SAM-dependent rRNA methyltransferase [Desulfovibrio aminophilus]|uniref:class I SAM-dependent rRNA methyltransferase n=1 Tax=Desulfovibrio aminophilus TaxID=81425 RepID=UPI0004820391|nr:class I SAM-dependent rRNA methyltransferase [Desulfovibrio aminophilus]